MAILALQQIRRMRGGAQAQLMLAEDGHPYVVKFQNNPQHLRVLANEWIATKLASAIGLTVPECVILEVTDWLIDNTPALEIDLGVRRERCKAGLCFGSRFVGGLMPGFLVDYLPDDKLARVRNLQEFAGILVVDKWTCNADGRQVVFTKKSQEKHYHATFIDFGYCFNGGEWTPRDAPLRGVFGRDVVYQNITGWENFEPWLSRIEGIDEALIRNIAETVPHDWFSGKHQELNDLVNRLLGRRLRIRELVDEFRNSSRHPFPHWHET